VCANAKSRDDANLKTTATTLQSVSEAMDADNDVLFLILMSHGSICDVKRLAVDIVARAVGKSLVTFRHQMTNIFAFGRERSREAGAFKCNSQTGKVRVERGVTETPRSPTLAATPPETSRQTET
jgi:hypothetical protein